MRASGCLEGLSFCFGSGSNAITGKFGKQSYILSTGETVKSIDQLEVMFQGPGSKRTGHSQKHLHLPELGLSLQAFIAVGKACWPEGPRDELKALTGASRKAKQPKVSCIPTGVVAWPGQRQQQQQAAVAAGLMAWPAAAPGLAAQVAAASASAPAAPAVAGPAGPPALMLLDQAVAGNSSSPDDACYTQQHQQQDQQSLLLHWPSSDQLDAALSAPMQQQQQQQLDPSVAQLLAQLEEQRSEAQQAQALAEQAQALAEQVQAQLHQTERQLASKAKQLQRLQAAHDMQTVLFNKRAEELARQAKHSEQQLQQLRESEARAQARCLRAELALRQYQVHNSLPLMQPAQVLAAAGAGAEAVASASAPFMQSAQVLATAGVDAPVPSMRSAQAQMPAGPGADASASPPSCEQLQAWVAFSQGLNMIGTQMHSADDVHTSCLLAALRHYRAQLKAFVATGAQFALVEVLLGELSALMVLLQQGQEFGAQATAQVLAGLSGLAEGVGVRAWEEHSL